MVVGSKSFDFGVVLSPYYIFLCHFSFLAFVVISDQKICGCYAVVSCSDSLDLLVVFQRNGISIFLNRDADGGRYISLIFGTNLTDVFITGNNETIDGQGEPWCDKFHKGELKYTRPYLIELMYSENIQISNLTLINSPSWNVHPIYSKNIIIQGITILAPVSSPNTDGINPDSCTNTRIEDCYIVSGDDCVAVKSGWDEYGITFGMPTQQLVIRRLTCISPTSAVIALGSEMSGGILDVRAEDIVAINSESGVRIKTGVGRGGFVKDIYVKWFTMHTMKWAFWMTGNYGSHPDDKWDPNAIPIVQNINYRDMVAENVTMSARLEGIVGDPFTGICISNVTIEMAISAKKLIWNCTDIKGISRDVTPQPCAALPVQSGKACDFPQENFPFEDVKVQLCSYRPNYMGNITFVHKEVFHSLLKIEVVIPCALKAVSFALKSCILSCLNLPELWDNGSNLLNACWFK